MVGVRGGRNFSLWKPSSARLDCRRRMALDSRPGHREISISGSITSLLIVLIAFCNDIVVILRRRTIALAGVSTFLIGCAQTESYAPKPMTASYSLENFSSANLQVVVRDLRAERDNSAALISAIQSQISNSLTASAATHDRYTLKVDVFEHRSFFTLGNWNASTRLRWRVQRENGSIIRDGVSVGEGHRSNMLDYATAKAVSQDAFDSAMADLLSSLSAVQT